MIGVDYPKIEYQLFGLDLLEPMALVTNSILGFLALFFALRVSKLTSKLPFYKYWKLFFLYFGIGIFLSGLGHTFYNQLGMYGKVIGWMSGPFAIFMAEKAMVSLHWDEAKKKLLNTLIIVKVIVAYAAFAVMLVITDESKIDSTNEEPTLEKNVEIKNEINQEIEKSKTEKESLTLEKNKNKLEEFELILPEDNSTIKLKTPKDVYLEIYKKARQKALDAKKEAIKAFLEAKKIKETYLLDEWGLDSSDEEDFFEEENSMDD